MSTRPAEPQGRSSALAPVAYARSFWAALFAGAGSISFDGHRWTVRTRAQAEALEAGAVTEVQVRPGLFWATLELHHNGKVLRFGGLAGAAAAHLHGLAQVAHLPARVAGALQAWERAVGAGYLNHHAWAGWRDQHADTRALLSAAPLHWLSASDQAKAQQLGANFDTLEERVATHNAAHIARELADCERMFDTVESQPLTQRQREAVVTHEDNTLVIAGAGTGKTSVVVAKVAYLIQRLGARPSEILLLAYNTAAAEEIQARIDARVSAPVSVGTFHKLGMQIIAAAEGRKPSLSKMADKVDEPAKFIDATLRAMFSVDRWRSVLVHHLVEHLRPYKAEASFASKSGYIRWVKAAAIKSMKGDQVRSHEECIIADWLYVNGLEYAYEPNYEHDVASKEFGQYRPDFRLIESGVYIEHFGVSRDGQPAPWIDAARYQAGMAWKRSTHQRFRTRLVETYSYDKQEGALTERLAARLAAVGVLPKPLPPAEVERVADGQGLVSQLSKLIATFLQHVKEARRTVAELRAGVHGDSASRAHSFLAIFEHVQDAYERALRAERAIDFQDMIGRAADLVEAGRFKSPYRYIIVDEFQDMSRGRARLLRSLLGQVTDRRLTCVGDDWQAIYRFAGSDLSQMTLFARNYGYTASVSLDTSFRFGHRLQQASERFVQKNPAQLRKTLRALSDEGRAAVVIVPASKAPAGGEGGAAEATRSDIEGILTLIAAEAPSGATVYLLGRYNFSTSGANIEDIGRRTPQLKVEFRTVHRSKGLQADYVVLLDVKSGRFGFPSEIVDDPLLSLVLSEPDGLEHAEERRLFYVALTRAKRRVYVLARETERSTFVEELLGAEYAGLVEAIGSWTDAIQCPDCGGTLVRRLNGKTGAPFWGCVDYPYCSGSAQVCAVCQLGAIVQDGATLRCNQKGCTGRQDLCPKCASGALVIRTNRHTAQQFWACTGWRADKSGCNYTTNVRPGNAPSTPKRPRPRAS